MDTTTGIIDIASVESIFKDGKFHHRLLTMDVLF